MLCVVMYVINPCLCGHKINVYEAANRLQGDKFNRFVNLNVVQQSSNIKSEDREQIMGIKWKMDKASCIQQNTLKGDQCLVL